MLADSNFPDGIRCHLTRKGLMILLVLQNRFWTKKVTLGCSIPEKFAQQGTPGQRTVRFTDTHLLSVAEAFFRPFFPAFLARFWRDFRSNPRQATSVHEHSLSSGTSALARAESGDERHLFSSAEPLAAPLGW
jgi:hypothetical protein